MSELGIDRLSLPLSDDSTKPVHSKRQPVISIVEWAQCFSNYIALVASEGVRPSGLPKPHLRGTFAIQRRWLGCIQSPLPTDCCYLPRGTVGTKEHGSSEHGFRRSPAQALLSTLLWLNPFLSGTPDTTGAPTWEKRTGSSKLHTTRICRDWNFFPQPYCPYPGCKFTHICLSCAKDLLSGDKNHKIIHCPNRAFQPKGPTARPLMGPSPHSLWIGTLCMFTLPGFILLITPATYMYTYIIDNK